MRSFRDYEEWQRGMDFVEAVYSVSGDFPQDERLGLTRQLRSAAASIPTNVAEGAGASSDKEFARCLTLALRSIYETMTSLELAQRLGFCSPAGAEELIQEADQIAAMLYGLRKRLLGVAGRVTDERDYVTAQLNPARPARSTDY